MSDSVIVLVADQKYLQYAKSLMVACRRQGSWRGDMALIVVGNCDTREIEDRGIHIVRIPDSCWSYMAKCHVFSECLRSWEYALYLDCDMLIQGDLNVLFDELSERCQKILCDTQDSTVIDDFLHFGRAYGVTPETHPESFARLCQEYPCVDKRIFCAGLMFFSPTSIPDGTTEKLLSTHEEFSDINPGNCDQPIINLVLYDQMEAIGKDYACWWAFDEPGNRVYSEANGWSGDESPAILHYWNSFAPWLEKTPDAGAYFNHRLGRPCREVYLENLAAFEEVFPCV